MKKLFSLILCLAMLFSIAACSAPKPADKETGKESVADKTEPTDEKSEDKKASENTNKEFKDTIVIVSEKEPDTLDPRRGNSVSNNIVMNQIYDALFYLDEEGQPQSRLAESWELVDDTTLKVKLKEGIVFSNGNSLTADDVLYCLERTLHDSTSKSTMEWYDPDNSTKEDDYNFTIKMKQPYAPVYWVLSGWRCWIGDKETMESMGEENYARAPIGTGPYKLVNWVTGSQIELERNENYWSELAKTEKVIIKFVPEPANRVIELETGAADVAYYINGVDRDRVNNMPNAHAESGLSPKYYLVTFNMQHELLSNQHVRNALSYAIDVPQLADVAFDGQATAMTGMYPSVFRHHKEIEGGFPYDPELAKKELAEAGYPDGFDIELHILPGSEYQRMAEVIQAYWQKIGVNARIEQSELGTREAQGPWETSIRTATADEISNVLIIYEQSFASRINSNDDVLEEKLQKLKTLYDDADRKALLEDIQDYLFEKKYTLPFVEVDTIYGVSDKVENFEFNEAIALLDIASWQVEK